MMNDVDEEVGEENVIQIVTGNATNYKVVGDLLQKRQKLYWTLLEILHRLEMRTFHCI